MNERNRRVLKWDPYDEPGEDSVEFRLTYQGLLLGSGNKKPRPEHKHEIRRVFHRQIRRQWEYHRALASMGREQTNAGTLIEARANLNARHGYRFVPLVTQGAELLCALDILFLRPGVHGGVIHQNGDIDNKLKTLFDAMQIPVDGSGLTPPADDEDPFFCLLQDDRLITHVSVETDNLLEPVSAPENTNDARLVITVRLSPYVWTFANAPFA